MCGRYAFSRINQQLLERLGLEGDALPDGLAPRWNIAPGQKAAALREGPGGRRLELLRWGFPRPGGSAGALVVNARVETAAHLPLFREAFATRRCALPCEGWYEWRRAGKARQPWFLRPAAGETVLLAGLWTSHAPGGCHVILTCPAAPSIAHLHERMPVVLDEGLWDAWLRGEGGAEEWRRLRIPWPDERLDCWPVSPEVNGTASDHAGLTAPVQHEQGSLFA
jgi:putative SOS response-associated peptidase YedK